MNKNRKVYAQYLRFLPVAGLRFTFYALYPSPMNTILRLIAV